MNYSSSLSNSYTRSSIPPRSDCPRTWMPSTKIYFPDGNIVLRCGTTTFKVHSGVLSRHSEVFRGMFMLPQPERREREGEDTIDGCPFVEMYGDDAVDVENLLLAIYDGLYINPPRPNTYPILLSALLLSTKYIIPHIQSRCISQLQRDFPVDLYAWDLRELAATTEGGTYVVRFLIPHPAFIIPLLWKCDLLQCLPAAYYDISRYAASRIVKGQIVHHMEREHCQLLGVEDIMLDGVVLSPDDRVRVLRGREAGQEYMAWFLDVVLPQIGEGICLREVRPASETPQPQVQVSRLHFHLSSLRFYPRRNTHKDNDPPKPPRRNDTNCRASLRVFHTASLRLAVGMVAGGREADPLYTLQEMMEMLTRGEVVDCFDLDEETGKARGCTYKLDLCEKCFSQAVEVVKDARKAVWMWLPYWFGIKSGVPSSVEAYEMV